MRVRAYGDLKEALAIEPDNSELNDELKELRQQMTQAELEELDSSEAKTFKRIAIEEDSGDEEDEGTKYEQPTNDMEQLS